MPRTPLLRTLSWIAGVHREALRTGIAAEQLLEAERFDRRSFLRGAMVGGAALLASGCTREPVAKRTGHPAPRIAIVGAGLSGMTTAYRLHQAGVSSTVYEASETLLGRTMTLRGFFADGQTAEQGGEFINSDHRAIRALALELGLALDDLTDHYRAGTEAVTYVDGGPYSPAAMLADWARVYPAVARDAKAAPWPTLWDRHSPDAARLDRMSLAEWIERNVPGGLRSRFGSTLSLGYTGEYALDPGDQSALNLLGELGYSPRRRLEIYGPQDWRYRIRGGNDRVVSALADRLPDGAAVLHSPLVALGASGDGTVRLTFASGAFTIEVVADRVVLALPFAALARVDLDGAGFSTRKLRAIRELGMGTNAKLHLQFGRRIWYESGSDGDTLSDTGYQETWEEDAGSPSPTGLLVNYSGGALGAGYPVTAPHAEAPESVTRSTLQQMAPVLPGIADAFNGRAYLDSWVRDPWHLGSYACFRPGQYTAFNGVQAGREGSVYFCGEHTSMNFQGFMNGAVASGERVSRELLADLGLGP
jgi:monoamine oxidase